LSGIVSVVLVPGTEKIIIGGQYDFVQFPEILESIFGSHRNSVDNPEILDHVF
jgi:hypothetical protein